MGIGFVGYGIVYLVQYLEGNLGAPDLPLLIALIAIGLALITSAGVLQQYLKRRVAAAVTSSA